MTDFNDGLNDLRAEIKRVCPPPLPGAKWAQREERTEDQESDDEDEEEAGVPPSPNSRRSSWTAKELMGHDFPEQTFAVPGLIPEGLTCSLEHRSWASPGSR
jgi:hypothetical protein